MKLDPSENARRVETAALVPANNVCLLDPQRIPGLGNTEPAHSIVAEADVANGARKRGRSRHSPPPIDTREWMTPYETALVLGCSVATVHRLRRGLIPGIEPLPCSQYGRKVIFRKFSVAEWQERTEKGRLAA